MDIFRSPAQTLRSDIEALRVEGRWTEIATKIQQFKEAGNELDDAGLKYYEGESTVELLCESILARQAVPSENDEKSPDGSLHPLQEVTEDLKNLLLQQNGEEEEIKKRLGSGILAKYEYVCNNLEEALEVIDSIKMDAAVFMEEQNPRTVRVAAEMYALKGICIETLHDSEQGGLAPPLEKAMECYETAAKLAFHLIDLLPETAFTRSDLELHAMFLGPLLERAVVAYVELHQRNYDDGDAYKSLERTRWLLRSARRRALGVLRLETASHLIEKLISGRIVVQRSRSQPPVDGHSDAKDAQTSPDLPSPATMEAPTSETEEFLLLLQVAGMLAADQIVLNMQSQFASLREMSLARVERLLHLSAIVSMRLDVAEIMDGFWRRVVSKCWDRPDLCVQFVDVMLMMGRYRLAYDTVRHIVLIDPENVGALLLTSRICIEHMDYAERGVVLAEQAMGSVKTNEERFTGFFLLGIAYSLMALSAKNAADPVFPEWSQKGLHYYRSAVELQPSDFRPSFNMALHHARITGDLSQAVDCVRACLMLNDDCTEAWHLMALVLSALGMDVEAYVILVDVEKNYELEKDDEVYFTILALLIRFGRYQDAVRFAQKMLLDIPHPSGKAEDSADGTENPAGSADGDKGILSTAVPAGLLKRQANSFWSDISDSDSEDDEPNPEQPVAPRQQDPKAENHADETEKTGMFQSVFNAVSHGLGFGGTQNAAPAPEGIPAVHDDETDESKAAPGFLHSVVGFAASSLGLASPAEETTVSVAEKEDGVSEEKQPLLKAISEGKSSMIQEGEHLAESVSRASLAAQGEHLQESVQTVEVVDKAVSVSSTNEEVEHTTQTDENDVLPDLDEQAPAGIMGTIRNILSTAAGYVPFVAPSDDVDEVDTEHLPEIKTKISEHLSKRKIQCRMRLMGILAELYLRLDEVAAAERILENAQTEHGGESAAYYIEYVKALVDLAKGEKGDAKRDFANAVSCKSDFTPGWLGLISCAEEPALVEQYLRQLRGSKLESSGEIMALSAWIREERQESDDLSEGYFQSSVSKLKDQPVRPFSVISWIISS